MVLSIFLGIILPHIIERKFFLSMLYVYNPKKFITKEVARDKKVILENVYGYDYVHERYETYPFTTIIRTHELELTPTASPQLKVCPLTFMVLHNRVSHEDYELYTKRFSFDEPIAQSLLIETPEANDTILLINEKLDGTIASMTNVLDYDVYSGSYNKFDKMQFLLKINRSFKLQKYLSKDKIYVEDMIFKYNHTKDILEFKNNIKEYPKAFLERNKKLFLGEKGSVYKNRVYELFFERNSRNYPR